MIQRLSTLINENCVIKDPNGPITVDLPYELEEGIMIVGYDMHVNIKRLETMPDFAPSTVLKTFFKPLRDPEVKPVLKSVMYATYESLCKAAGQPTSPMSHFPSHGRMVYKGAADA